MGLLVLSRESGNIRCREYIRIIFPYSLRRTGEYTLSPSKGGSCTDSSAAPSGTLASSCLDLLALNPKPLDVTLIP